MNKFVLLSVGLGASFFLSLPSAVFSAGFTSSASSTGMSAASAGSNSLRASSGAISTSSTSSTGEADVAAGQYRLTAMRTDRTKADAKADARADALATVRLTLTPIVTDASGFEFDLQVPEQAMQQHQMKPGDTIHVARQPFGLEFAHGTSQQSFFLVLAEEWEQNLGTYQLQR